MSSASLERSAERRSPNDWGKVPLWWLEALQGCPNALRVAVTLSAYANDSREAWPSAETIATETGIRRDRVFEALNQLKARGIIEQSLARKRKTTVHTLRYTVPTIGTHDVGTPASGEMSTDKRVLRVPVARSTIRTRSEQRSDRGGNPPSSSPTAEQNAAAGSLLDALSLLRGPLSSASDERQWRAANIKAAREWLTEQDHDGIVAAYRSACESKGEPIYYLSAARRGIAVANLSARRGVPASVDADFDSRFNIQEAV